MPWICLKCESRVDERLIKKDTFICPSCSKILTKSDLFRVAKRYLAKESEEIQNIKKRIKRKKQKGLLKQQRRLIRQKRGK